MSARAPHRQIDGARGALPSDERYERTRRLALKLAGIELAERHRGLLERRAARIGLDGGSGIDALLEAAERGAAAAVQRFLCLLTTKFTGFFRHPAQIERAAAHALRGAEHRGRASLWSAAAATGEEPYSLAMALVEQFGRDHPPATVLATDVDSDALATAQRGEYASSALECLDAARRDRFFQSIPPGRWRVVPALREMIQFRALNLCAADWPVVGPFDVILCRNVLMYLENEIRESVARQLTRALAPEGLLVLDPVENLGRAGSIFTSVAEGVFALSAARTTRARRRD